MILCLNPNPSIDKYLWIKDIEAGAVNRVIREKSYPGGKGIHVAMGLRELGEEVTVLGFWGGSSGKWIRRQCASLGIKCPGPIIKGWSRTCLTIKSEGRYNETEILGKGPDIGKKEFGSFVKTYKKWLKESHDIVMSGSWPQTHPDYGYSLFLDMASKEHKTTFVDCSGEWLKDALAFHPDTVHISYQEGLSYFGERESIEGITEKLSGSCRQVAVSNGEKGLFLRVDDQTIHALVHVENVISAVGSGDSLLAGLVYARTHNYSFEDTARLAVACGAANCIREDLGLFYKKDVEQLFSHVELNML